MLTELEQERSDLARAERGLSDGRARIGRQMVAVAAARDRRVDTTHAERLLQTLHGTLETWERHRDLLVARIAYLEHRT